MSIVKNVWLRGMKKRLGGAVTYTMGGQQIARELAANVKNPRTPAQMVQRVKLSALVNFYRAMRSWAKTGAFSNKKSTWSDYNAFVSANITSTPVFLTKQQAQAGCSVVAPYVISRGIMPRVETSYDSTTEAFASDIYIGDIDETSGRTLGEYSQAIIANNNGIANGDQISIISVIQRTSDAGPFVIQRAYEFTLDVTSNVDLSKNGMSQFLYAFEYVTGKYALGHIAEEANMGCAFIISRKQGGKILTGDAQLCLTPTATSFLANYRSLTQLNAAIASYGTGDNNFLDPTTRGDSSNQATLSVQLLSVNMGNKTYSQGDNLGSKPNALGDIYIGTSVPVNPDEVDEVVFYNDGGDVLVALNGAFSSQAGQLRVALDAQQITDILADWNGISYLKVNIGDVSATFNWSNNGGSADEGDVTP